ncbi:MAG TPA: FHA domain-containing protein [Anaerolineaceae bacterium]|nr:FHA domain-containing protein [Anaerolineaceae bacterium]
MSATVGLILRILFLAFLYAFLGLAIWMLWRSVVSKQVNQGNIAIPSLTLSSKIGEEPMSQNFATNEVLIGRSLDCDFILDHSTVSSRHARLFYHLNQWWFEDLKSTNGSYLDGIRVEEPIVVKDNDEFYCGDAIFTLFIKPVEQEERRK